jgi:hypothetical protein
MCVHLEVKYQQCKLTCNACERLQAAIQGETGLQVRLVQQLSPCNDMHPSCKAWAQQDSCSKDPQAMLGLCQVSSTDCSNSLTQLLSSPAAAGKQCEDCCRLLLIFSRKKLIRAVLAAKVCQQRQS